MKRAAGKTTPMSTRRLFYLDRLRSEAPPPETESPEKLPHGALERFRCTRCVAPMVLRRGQYGLYLGCSRYPRCSGTSQVPSSLAE